MSESTGSGGAPNGAAPPAGGGGDSGAPSPTPLGQSPRLQGGMSIDQAISEHARRRKGAPPPRQSPAAPAANGANGEALPAPPETVARSGRTNGATPPAGANGHDTETARDPIDALIGAYRDRHAPPAPAANDPAAPNGTAAGPQATPAATPTNDNGSVRLTIGDRVAEFTPDQLRDHVLRSQDYTKKTQELAEYNRKLNAQAETINRLMPVLIPEVERQIAMIDQHLGKRIDWQHLAESDPREYQRQDALWKEAAAERERLAGISQLNEQENEAFRAQRMQQGHAELAKVLPGWEDPARRASIQKAMKDWGHSNGYPEAELNNVWEPRHVATLFKAMAFDRLMAGVRSGKTPVVPNIQHRGMPRSEVPSDLRQKENTFAQAPTVRNAISLYAARRRSVN